MAPPTLVLALALVVVAGVAPAQARWNLLVICTDEHHPGTLGCYGGRLVATPNLDRLAAEGARFTSAYATTPVCSPSRAALFTGRYPQATGVVRNDVPLPDDAITFAEVLRRAGYATGYAGKWHLDGSSKPGWAPRRRFGFEDNRFMFNRGHWKRLADGPRGPRVAARDARDKPTYAVAGADETSYTTDWLTGKAIEFVEAHRGRPFCYVLSLPDPHGPNTVRAPYADRFARTDVRVPASFRDRGPRPTWAPRQRRLTERRLRRLMRGYLGMVKCIDDNVGRLLDRLRALDLLDRTIVVFTADHGDLCGEHGRTDKGLPYEGSARVPLLVRAPGRVPAGLVVCEAVANVDLAPTLLGMLGLEPPPATEGRDLSALFEGRRPADPERIAFLRGTAARPWSCAVTDRFKLVLAPGARPWLFDLQVDPLEQENAAASASTREVARRLARALLAYARRRHDPFPALPDVRAQLRGIVGGR